jgi:hypothetical protein
VTPLNPSPQHPWSLLLAQLNGFSALLPVGDVSRGLVHDWGDEADAKRPPSQQHITWTPEGAPFEEPRTFALPKLGVLEGLYVVPHAVTIYGGSPVVAIQRAADLLGQLPLLLGPRPGNAATTPPTPGWTGRAKGSAIKGGELGAAPWLIKLAVSLKLFIWRELFGQAPLLSFTATTQAVNPNGSTETAVVATS